jgi:transposase, IS5 family
VSRRRAAAPCLKRGYGWDRTRLDSLEGAKTWTGQGVFTHNLTKIVVMIA